MRQWKHVFRDGVLNMSKTSIGAAVSLATLALSASAVQAHSLFQAKEKLYNLGYSSVRTERASLPYSFSACKRGARYHIHMNWYGDLVQVDATGPCGEYGYRDRSRRRDHDEY